jgi:hypothetical protein
MLMAVDLTSCDEDDPLAPNVALTGKVTNNSGVTGPIIVEVNSPNLRDVADAEGRYEIRVHRDFYVDSLYAWVDNDGNGQFTNGEPHGFYGRCPFQVRDIDVVNLNFGIQGP